jgi:hypothetical protein
MMRVTNTRMLTKKLSLVLTLGALLGACLSQPPDNLQPIARITIDGMPTAVAQSGAPPLVLPPGAMVTLNGSTSLDQDGVLMAYEWWDTGTPAAERFTGDPVLASGASVFAPDLGMATTASVSGEDGSVYSLYVIDDTGEVSKPATVMFMAAQ